MAFTNEGLRHTAKAILAKYNGDRARARTYCLVVADLKTELREEYTRLADLVETL